MIEEVIPVLSTNVETTSDTTDEVANENATDKANNILWIIIAVGAIAVIAVGAQLLLLKRKRRKCLNTVVETN